MKKNKYTEPWIKVMRVIPEGETCGVLVYFGVPGPGVAGANNILLTIWAKESCRVII